MSDKAGTIDPSQLSDVELTLSFIRNGKVLKTDDEKYNWVQFLKGFDILESITGAAMQARFILEDAGGFFYSLSGSELIRLTVKSPVVDRTYNFRAYGIVDRVRTPENTDIFMINATSDEFIKNEIINIFGHSDVIFKKGRKAEDIIKTLMKDKKYIGSPKDLFFDKGGTLNNHTFVCPNWRPLDLIYWISQRTIRKSQKGGTLQNGFAFYENSMGYHFRSIDGMVDDANKQGKAVKDSKVTDFKSISGANWNAEKIRTYKYKFIPKSAGDQEADRWGIEGMSFPDDKSFLMGLRHGSWSGYSIGFDPTTLGNSKMGADQSKDISNDTYRYNLSAMWNKMSHIGGSSKQVNPQILMDSGIKKMLSYPKRVRYTALPNQVFDPKFKKNPQKNYEQLVELQAYQWMRIESIKAIKLQIKVPGNLDLHAGCAIDIDMPATYKLGDSTPVDKKYSGRYIIAGVTHECTGLTLKTTLLLMKDSIHSNTINWDPDK